MMSFDYNLQHVYWRVIRSFLFLSEYIVFDLLYQFFIENS